MGRRSLRVAAAAALNLCKLLLDNPWAAPFYADELQQLLLFDPKTNPLPGHVVRCLILIADCRAGLLIQVSECKGSSTSTSA